MNEVVGILIWSFTDLFESWTTNLIFFQQQVSPLIFLNLSFLIDK